MLSKAKKQKDNLNNKNEMFLLCPKLWAHYGGVH